MRTPASLDVMTIPVLAPVLALRSRTASEGLEPGPEGVETGHAAERGSAALVPTVQSVLSETVEEIVNGWSVSDDAAVARSVIAVVVVIVTSVDLKMRRRHLAETRSEADAPDLVIVSAADPVTANAVDEADPVTVAVDPVKVVSKRSQMSPWSHHSGTEAWVLVAVAMTAIATMGVVSLAPTEMGTTCRISIACR